MINFIIEELTAIDELADLAKLWPEICGYLENELGWGYLSSFTISLLIALAIIFIPGTLIVIIIKAIWNKLKRS